MAVRKRIGWFSLGVYLVLSFVVYPPVRSGGQWSYLHGAPTWVIVLAAVTFLGAVFGIGYDPDWKRSRDIPDVDDGA
jgi:hypothetical protein